MLRMSVAVLFCSVLFSLEDRRGVRAAVEVVALLVVREAAVKERVAAVTLESLPAVVLAAPCGRDIQVHMYVVRIMHEHTLTRDQNKMMTRRETQTTRKVNVSRRMVHIGWLEKTRRARTKAQDNTMPPPASTR